MIKTFLILVLIYLALEFGRFAYKYKHLPALPSTDQSEKTLGSGPALRYIAAGDSTAVGEGASDTVKTYAYQIAQALAKTHTLTYKNIAVKGSQTPRVLGVQVEHIITF